MSRKKNHGGSCSEGIRTRGRRTARGSQSLRLDDRVGEGDRVTVEPVKEGDRFSIGEMENVSKKGVKRAEETAISAKQNDVYKSRQRCKGRAEICRTGSCK